MVEPLDDRQARAVRKNGHCDLCAAEKRLGDHFIPETAAFQCIAQGALKGGAGITAHHALTAAPPDGL